MRFSLKPATLPLEEVALSIRHLKGSLNSHGQNEKEKEYTRTPKGMRRLLVCRSGGESSTRTGCRLRTQAAGQIRCSRPASERARARLAGCCKCRGVIPRSAATSLTASASRNLARRTRRSAHRQRPAGRVPRCAGRRRDGPTGPGPAPFRCPHTAHPAKPQHPWE